MNLAKSPRPSWERLGKGRGRRHEHCSESRTCETRYSEGAEECEKSFRSFRDNTAGLPCDAVVGAFDVVEIGGVFPPGTS
jgi:hypothetical protein